MPDLQKPPYGAIYRHKLTLVEEFDRYIASIYDTDELSPDQVAEVRNAFFAGCCLAYASDRDYLAEIKGFFAALEASTKIRESKAADEALDRWMNLHRTRQRAN